MAGHYSKHRFNVWSATQHPYKHGINEFAYAHASLPGVTNLEELINWLVAVLYPQSMPTVANPAALPPSGTFTVTTGSPGTIDKAAHLFLDTDAVTFTTTGTLPAGLSLNTTYYVQNSAANSFQVSTDKAGASLVNITDAGTGVHTVAPIVGAYKVVTDDGDGKAAAYRWEAREGAVAQWYKVYDMDWGQDAILTAFYNVTQDRYVTKYGIDDADELGVPLVGQDSGQHVYGGLTANTNLTLHANAGDGLGPSTGYIQTDDNVRPTADATYNLGTALLRYLNLYLGGTASIDTMILGTGSITDSSGAISFGDENLSTTGTLGAGATTVTQLNVDNLRLDGNELSSQDVDGNIEVTPNGAGQINLNKNTAVTGTLSATLTALINGTLTLGTGSITDSSGAISFDNENLSTTGTLQAGNTTVTQLNSDNVRVDGNTISTLDVNGDLTVDPNGTGRVLLNKNTEITGTLITTGQATLDDVAILNGDISTTGVDQDLTLSPNGVGDVIANANILPGADATYDLGALASRIQNLYLSGALSDGTNQISSTVLTSFRDANVGVNTGDALFWDGTKWVASNPDAEILHDELGNLVTGDAGHTQFAMLAGRAGGQTLQGGTGAGENLTLESTSNGTKGTVQTSDNLVPDTNASYSTQWDGLDLGDGTHYFRNLYTKGEAIGLRPENQSSNPANNALNVGRLVFNTTENALYHDIGTRFRKPVYENGETQAGVTGANAAVATSTSLLVRLTNASLTSIGSVFAPVGDYKILILVNVTGADINVVNNYGSAPAGEAVLTGTGANLVLANNSAITLTYDQASTLWRVVGITGISASVQTALNLKANDNAVVHLAGSETITGVKTFDVETTYKEIATPSNPSSGYLKIYPKTDGSFYQLDSTGLEQPLGGGSGTGKNYFSSAVSKGDSIVGFNSYNDNTGVPANDVYPVDGTGGSPSGNLTLAVSSSNPLSGLNSITLTKTAANLQGEGKSIDFTLVDTSDKGKMLAFSMNYAVVSGTYADDDMLIYFYDVTNSVLLQPTPYKIKNHSLGSDKFFAEIQIPYNCNTLRLIFHQSSTSALAYTLKFDDFLFGPQAKLYGSVATDLISYVPSLTNGTNVNTTLAKWSKSADRGIGKVFLTGVGAGAGGVFAVSLPFTIDTTKINAVAGYTVLGYGDWYDSSAGSVRLVAVVYSTTNSVQFEVEAGGALSGADWGAGDYLSFDFDVPAVGFSSSQLLSHDADTRVFTAKTTLAGGATHTNTGNWQDLPSSTWTVIKDSHGVLSNGVATVNIAGDFVLSGVVPFSANTTGIRSVRAVLNGTPLDASDGCAGYAGDDNFLNVIYDLPNLKSGDIIKLQAYQNSGGNLNYGTCQFNLTRKSGTAQIAASEKVKVHYYTNAGQSIANGGGGDVVVFGTKREDTHGAFNSSTGVFTFPRAGTAKVVAKTLLTTGGSWDATDESDLYIQKNGSNWTVDANQAQATHTGYMKNIAIASVQGIQGDTIQARLFQNSGGAIALYNGLQANEIIIEMD